MRESKLQVLLEDVRQWLAQHPAIEAVLWFMAALACIAVLVWFLGFSGFGNPPEFVYEQF